jgi:hypothetical protein
MERGKTSFPVYFGQIRTYTRLAQLNKENQMATKADALAWLASQSPISAVGTPILVQTNAEFGDNIYVVNVRKIKPVTLDCVRYENIQFVVLNEGQGNESAYFMNNNTIAWDNDHENPVTPL